MSLGAPPRTPTCLSGLRPEPRHVALLLRLRLTLLRDGRTRLRLRDRRSSRLDETRLTIEAGDLEVPLLPLERHLTHLEVGEPHLEANDVRLCIGLVRLIARLEDAHAAARHEPRAHAHQGRDAHRP